MNLYVKPAALADGTTALVRQPQRGWQPLPPEGGWVPSDEYWNRRVRDGDVIETAPPPDPADEPSAPAPTRKTKRG